MELDISTDVWNKVAGNFCSDKWKDELDDWNDITIIERIGSESSEGEVYRIQIEGREYAGKIMPISSVLAIEKNENEIAIAKELSGLTYFPIVYAGGFCSNTKYNEKSLFFEDSYKYFLFEKVCEDKTKACKTRMKHQYKNISVQELKTMFYIPINISSHILISEIAFSDLRQICRYYTVNEKIWRFIILNVLKGIKCLNEEKNILHGDLHCGNVLIKVSEKNQVEIPLIHDFGKSRKCLFDNMSDRVTDAEKFLYDLTLHVDVPKSIKTEIEEILKYISSIFYSKSSYPIMDEIISLF